MADDREAAEVLDRFLAWYSRQLDGPLVELREAAVSLALEAGSEQGPLIVGVATDLARLKDDGLAAAAVAARIDRPRPASMAPADLAAAIDRRLGPSTARVVGQARPHVRADADWIVRLAVALGAGPGRRLEIEPAAEGAAWTLRIGGPDGEGRPEPSRLARALASALGAEIDPGPAEVVVRLPG